MFNRFYIILFLSFTLLSFNYSLSQNFNTSQIKTLFDSFNKQSKTPLNYKVLEDFLKDVKIEDLKNDLFVQSLPQDSKNDYFALCNAMKTFIDNLPQKQHD